MINREIPFRPRLEGEFRVRFYNAASEITEKTPTLTIARIAEREIEWVEKDCQYNIEQRKKYRAVWFLFRDLIRASWKACYRNGVIYMSLPTLNGTDMHDTTSPEVKALLRSWMSESRHERLVGYTDFINRMENPGTNKQSIAALIADGDELEKRIKRVHTGEIAIEAAVQPYLQLVRENDRDVFTGLKTSEIWRYFRLTWSTPVETTPGRTMQYLIRDAAHPMHAVMGIASLENCAVQITCRDDYIGWNQKAFIERIVTVDNDRAKEKLKEKDYSKEDLLQSETPVYDEKKKASVEFSTLWNLAKERASACATDDAARLVFGETMYDMLALEASSHPVNCLKILGTSAGMLYPPDQMHPNKRFVLSQDILEMILRSTVSPDEVLSGNDMRNRLWERFGIIIGGSTYEIEKLQSSGMLLQIDEDSLERNFTSFAALLESMDFAEVMADGILQIRLGGSD